MNEKFFTSLELVATECPEDDVSDNICLYKNHEEDEYAQAWYYEHH